MLLEKIHSLFDSDDGRGIHNHVGARMISQSAEKQARLRLPFAFSYDVSQIRSMKAGDVLCRITQLQLIKNVMTNPPGRARGERRNRTIRKMNSQTA